MEKTKLNAIVFLALSIFLEVFATAMLKMSDGMQNLIPMGISIVGYLVSLYFLGLCLKKNP